MESIQIKSVEFLAYSQGFILNDTQNMKTISLKQRCLDIYSPNLIHVNLGDLTSWQESAGSDKLDLREVISIYLNLDDTVLNI